MAGVWRIMRNHGGSRSHRAVRQGCGTVDPYQTRLHPGCACLPMRRRFNNLMLPGVTIYAFQLPNFFPDYPKLGVWPDAYYLSIDELDPNTFAYSGVLVCALDRSSMLAGIAASAQCFQVAS